LTVAKVEEEKRHSTKYTHCTSSHTECLFTNVLFDTVLGMSELSKVYVIGAGPSGLAAAWRLKEAGRDVVVLESRDRVGGQLLSISAMAI